VDKCFYLLPSTNKIYYNIRSDLMQENIKIGEVIVPTILKEEMRYYPISYVMNKVLLKKTDQGGIKGSVNGYNKCVIQESIDYGQGTGGIQTVNCISEEGLKEVLKNSKIGRLNVDQKKAMNVLLEYLGMDLISEDERFLKKLSAEKIKEYPMFIQDCINEVLKENPNIVWQKCTKCGNYYPYHINFYRDNPHPGKTYNLYTVCRDCCGWNENRAKDFIRLNDNEITMAYREYGQDIYELYKNHDVIGIYKNWLENSKKMFPRIIANKDDILTIIKYYNDNGAFDKYDEITLKVLKDKVGITLNKYINISDTYPIFYEFPVAVAGEIQTLEEAKVLINGYLKYKNIVIEDIYNFDYRDILKQCKLIGFMERNYNNSLLDFIMDYYNNEYAPYKFCANSGFAKYWESKDNRDFALKFLIEKDMQIPIHKIPLYITKTSLREYGGSSTMYNVLHKYYKGSVYEWVNECYPNEFVELDFNINAYRNEFDSHEEKVIHDILKENLIHVTYNPRNTDNTVKINGSIPDWYSVTDNGFYIVEYFGIALDHGDYNERIHDYKEKTKEKIEKYDKIEWIKKVYLYPEDLKDNFKGLKEKIKVIV
jgi:hypothetical protein